MTTTGDLLRDQGIDDVLAADTAAHRGYADLVTEGVHAFVKAGIDFTADDIRDWIDRHHPGREPHHPNAVGAAIRTAAKGLASPAGFVESTRPSRHSAVIRVWRPIARRAA